MRLSHVARLGVLSAWVLAGGASAFAQGGASALAGRWDAFVHANDVDAPFPFEMTVDGSSIKGTLFNGERRFTSAPARLEGDSLSLKFEQYAAVLKLTVKDGALTGEYVRPRGAPYPFRATKAVARAGLGQPAVDRGHVDHQREEQQGRDRRGASSPSRRARTSRPPSCAWTATPAR